MKKERLYKFLRPLCAFAFRAYYHPQIINPQYIPKNGSAVLAGNHKHFWDPILVGSSTKRVVHTLAKQELHDGKFSFFFRSVGSIPVDTAGRHNKGALNAAVSFLKNNSLINVSPEGTRNRTSEVLLPFKVGAVVMAQRANCKIVPYSVTGDYKFRSKNLKITFAPPLDVSELTVEDANSLLFNTVKDLCGYRFS